jgi:hypothetical protein
MTGMTCVQAVRVWSIAALVPIVVWTADIPVAPADTNNSVPTSFLPTLINIIANGGSSYAVRAGDENFAKGGVDLTYEKVEIHCDTLRYWQTAVPEVKRLVLERGLLLAGPNGRDPERVILDSRMSELPQVTFRGLMKPAEVEILRQPPDARLPSLVRFKVLLKKAGNWFGKLKTEQGWQPYAGWAEEVEMNLRADIDVKTKELINHRFDAIYMRGRPKSPTQTRELALIIRLKKPLTEETPARTIPEDACKGSLAADTITILFDDTGAVWRVQTDGKSNSFGDPDLFDSKPIEEPSRPELVPGK